MECFKLGVTIKGDKTGKLAKIVESVAGHDSTIGTIMAGYFSDQGFIDFIKNDEKVGNKFKDFNSFNGNSLKRLLKEYFNKENKRIDNTVSKNIMSILQGFSSTQAINVARRYVADSILEEYLDNEFAYKNKDNRKKLILNIKNKINKEFINEVGVNVVKKLISENNNKEEQTNDINDTRNLNNEYNKSVKEYINIKNKINNFKGSLEELKQLKEDIITAKEKVKELKIKRYNKFQYIVNKYGNIREKNYAALTFNLNGNPKEFFITVFSSNKLRLIASKFKNDLNSEYIFNINSEDFSEQDLLDTNYIVDTTTKNWDNGLKSSFDKHVSDKLKMYLDTLPNLLSPINNNEELYNYDTNNELGVRTTMNSNYVISQISNLSPFYSLEDFISKIEKASKTINSLYGLGKLVRDIRKNRIFAQYVFSQLDNPKIIKTGIKINEQGDIEFYQSNSVSDPLTCTINTLLNSVKNTYRNAFSLEDKKNLLNHLSKISKFKNDSTFTNSESIKDITENIKNILIKYIPNINTQGIENYLLNNEDGVINNYKNLINDILYLLNSVSLIINDYNKEIEELRKNKQEEIDYEFNINNINFNRLNKPIIELSKKIVKFTAIKNQLNSFNAENKLSSDLINNNWITNLIKQINYGTKENEYEGLEKLKEFIVKNKQYDYSPIFYGVKDSKNNTIVEGIFNKNYITGEVTVNKDAKKLINLYLFDGIKDVVSNTGMMYKNMSKHDYFITSISMYFQPINVGELLTETDYNIKNRFANYFLRTPSDAPKNFILQTIKYNTNDLFIIEQKDKIEYFKNVIEQINNNIKFNNGELNSKSDYIFSNKNKLGLVNNEISKEEFYEKLFKEFTPIKEVNNLTVYKGNEENIFYLPYIYNNNILWFKGNKVNNKENFILENLTLDSISTANKSNKISDDSAIDLMDIIIQKGIEDNKIKTKINIDNEAYNALFTHLFNELNNYIFQLNNVFEKINGKWGTKDNTKYLFKNASYKGNSIVDDKTKRLSGDFFSIFKLFKINDLDVNESIINELFLYRELNNDNSDNTRESLFIYENGKLTLNLNRTDLISEINGEIKLTISNDNINILKNIVSKWIENYNTYVRNDINNNYNYILEDYTFSEILDYKINNEIMLMSSDDLLEGDAKFYGTPDKLLKRTKELQAGGKSYGVYDINDNIGTELKNIKDENGKDIVIKIKDKIININNGFRAVTIKNVNKSSDKAQSIKDELKNHLSKTLNEELSEQIATSISKKYFEKSKPDDAQSYITLEEFIKREYAYGTLTEYGNLIEQLLDDNVSIEDINLEKVESLIQVRKNFYFDKQYDNYNRTTYPRQIKNAEFVLIPKFIKGTHLEKLYDIMVKHNIGQVNTNEASKATNVNILEFWDENGNIHPEEFDKELSDNGGTIISNYYYRHLYRQLDFPQHMKDETNNLGIQIAKKLIDNYTEKTKHFVDNYLESYSANIEEDYEALLNYMGWKEKEGIIINKDETPISFDKFYELAKLEAERLGIDNNFLDYLEKGDNFEPIMPNFLNIGFNKFESVAQSIFNNHIRKQTLPGFHATQVASVGFNQYVNDENGNNTVLQYRPTINGEQKRYVEILIPRYDSKIPKGYSIEDLEKEGLDLMVIYRIPTEGKGSVSIAKIKGFLPETYGSTIIIPDEWVTQTGSDNDGDSIYGISFSIYKDKNDKIKKIPYISEKNDKSISKRYENYIKNNKTENILSFEEFAKLSVQKQNSRDARNNNILNNFISIIKHDDCLEENLTGSTFEDISEAMEVLDDLRKTNKINRSFYNSSDQLDFMENAISGMNLKAISVSRDTFNSISNKVKGVVSNEHSIIVEYYIEDGYNPELALLAYKDDVTLYDKNENVTKDVSKAYKFIVKHNKHGWSNNNRNIVGKLITTYSAQTSAHSFDIIKKGTIFNENEYTFGVLKTMIDNGIDYKTAIEFLGQPAITMINKYVIESNSVYFNRNGNPVNNAIKQIAKELNIRINGKEINEYTPIHQVINLLSINDNIITAFEKLFGASISYKQKFTDIQYTLNRKLLEKRLKNEPLIDENLISSKVHKKTLDYVFDLAMIVTFNNIKNTSNTLEEIIKYTRVDKLGATKDIRSARKLITGIKKIILDKNSDIYKVITVKGKNILEALYPGIEVNKLDIDKSEYKYLAYFLKYVTDASVKINSKLFKTESNNFNSIINNIEYKLGRELDDKEVKELKKYIISYLFHNVEQLTTPTTVNNIGIIVNDIESIEEYSKDDKNYIELEKIRIFGLNKYTNDITIKDVNNPTTEEIKKFNKLSPAEKIIFIQTNFNENKGVFEYLDVSMFNTFEYKEKGFTKPTINFNGENDNINDVYIEFEKSFFNKNPLIKLATYDLIKYAFIVEGYDTKRNNVSKIISNKTLYMDKTDKGTGIISDINYYFESLINTNKIFNTNFVDMFVRSHSDIIKTINLPKAIKNKQGIENIAFLFNKYIQGENLVRIPFTEDAQPILELLKYNDSSTKEYINISKWVGKNQRRNTLYKIYIKNGGVYLIPMNKLERYEISNKSLNNKNNIYKNYEYYKALIDNAAENNITVKQYINNEKYIENITQLNSLYDVKYETIRENITNVNINELERISVYGGTLDKVNTNNFINDIKNYIKLPVEGGMRFGVIYNDYYKLKDLFYKTTPTVQSITNVDGSKTIVSIKKYIPSIEMYKAFNSQTYNEERLFKEELNVLNKILNAKSINPTLYKIEILQDKQVKDDFEKNNNKKIDDINTSFAITNIIEDIDFNFDFEYNDIDKTARKIINDMNRQSIRFEDKFAEEFRKEMIKAGIDKLNTTDIHNNKINIYAQSSKFYSEKANRLIHELDNFLAADGNIYKVYSKEFFDYLKISHEDYNKVVKLILDCKTFGKQIKDIFELNIDSEDKVTKEAINKIKDSINKVINNPKVKQLNDLLFNDYIANNYSTNPLIKNSIVELKTVFGDTSWFDAQFSDIGELNNSQVQAVVKYAYEQLNKITKLEAPKKVREFNNKWDEIVNKEGKLNFNKIINDNGKLLSAFTQDFIDKIEYYNSKEKELLNKYKTTDYEYISFKLEKDKWYADNIHREIIRDFYVENNKILEKVLKEAKNEYLEYNKLITELYDKNNIEAISEKEIERKKQINDKIKKLLSEVDDEFKIKSKEELDKINSLKEFINKKKEINNKYYENTPTFEFIEKLKYYTNVIKEYNNNNPNLNLEEKLISETFKEAYDWIQINAIEVLDENSRIKINRAFEIMKKDKTIDYTIDVTKKLVNKENAYDEIGKIDGRKLSKEAIQEIKKEAEKRNKGKLIKEVPKDIPVLKQEIYDSVDNTNEQDKEFKQKLIDKINEIMIKSIDADTKQISTKLLFENCKEDELVKLASYYDTLRDINRQNKSNNENSKKFFESVHFKVNQEAFDREYNYALENLKNEGKFVLWQEIFLAKDKNGAYVDAGGGEPAANTHIFGYITAKSKEAIDVDKTNAKKLINDNVEYKTNDYYEIEKSNAIKNGMYEEWYESNHYYDISDKEMKPLSIWTNMRLRPDGSLKAKYTYAPMRENAFKYVKNEYKNSEYRINERDYNSEHGNYDNYKSLSNKEKEMINLLKNIMREHITSNGVKKFIAEGYLPRRVKYEPNLRWYGNQTAAALGFTFGSNRERKWSEHLDYSHDVDIDFPMTSFIKTKGYKEILEYPTQGIYESNEQYAKRIDDIKKANEDIKQHNLKLEKEILDKDWKSVFGDFIEKAMDIKARNNIKNTIYLLLEDLKDNNAYSVSRWNGRPIRDLSQSTTRVPVYKMTEQERTYNIFENWGRRIIYNQFKKNTKYAKWADLMQNITSAKFMIFNVTGGIANVGTGLANIVDEIVAKEYFNKNDFLYAQAKYFKSSINFIADMYSEKSNDLTVAITKLFDVIDYEAFNERRPNETATEHVRRIRNLLYSLQSGGEHYMQNTALFAMLRSHRIYKDIDGTIRAGNINNYIWNIEIKTLMDILKDNKDLLFRYKSFIKNVKYDISELHKYTKFHKNINQEFLEDVGDKNLIKQYIKERDKNIIEAKKVFNNFETVESQFELIDGIATIKPNSKLTKEMFGQLNSKVISVNKKIHGIYDKLGAAAIEKEWWGGLLMQYHKHIYPGIMKRYRTKGYYNEIRESVELGSYISLFKLFSKEYKKLNKANNEDTDNNVIKSIKNITKATIDTFINMKYNYELMPEWERHNVNRALGDLMSIASVLMFAIAIHLMTDDDELKDNEVLATSLYIADRLNSEIGMYFPLGLYSEYSTLWSNPIASTSGIKDIFKAINFASQYLINPDFNVDYTTGINAGENKFKILLNRNIPIYRQYKRLTQMTKNNEYYRINESALNIKVSKNIADEIEENFKN